MMSKGIAIKIHSVFQRQRDSMPGCGIHPCQWTIDDIGRGIGSVFTAHVFRKSGAGRVVDIGFGKGAVQHPFETRLKCSGDCGIDLSPSARSVSFHVNFRTGRHFCRKQRFISGRLVGDARESHNGIINQILDFHRIRNAGIVGGIRIGGNNNAAF
jgi:hypothetical protein